MGTTCSCFKDNQTAEVLVINKETCVVQSLENQESLDMIAQSEHTTEVNNINIIKLQGIVRGYLDRKKSKQLIQDLITVASTSSNPVRESLKLYDGEYPCYPNTIVDSIKQKYSIFQYSEPLQDKINVIRKGPIKLENEAVYFGEWNLKNERHGRGSQN